MKGLLYINNLLRLRFITIFFLFLYYVMGFIRLEVPGKDSSSPETMSLEDLTSTPNEVYRTGTPESVVYRFVYCQNACAIRLKDAEDSSASE